MADEVEPTELDRLLRHELSVEPSASFLPAVRARVERERNAASKARPLGTPVWLRLPRWQLLATAAAAVLALAASAVLFVRAPATPDPTPAMAVGTVPTPATDPVGKAPLPPASTELAALAERLAHSRMPRAVVPRRRADVPVAEVIVDPGQRAAISRVMELVNSGRLTEASFVASRPSALPMTEEVTATPIAIDPLAVSPFVVGGVLQKGIERN